MGFDDQYMAWSGSWHTPNMYWMYTKALISSVVVSFQPLSSPFFFCCCLAYSYVSFASWPQKVIGMSRLKYSKGVASGGRLWAKPTLTLPSFTFFSKVLSRQNSFNPSGSLQFVVTGPLLVLVSLFFLCSRLGPVICGKCTQSSSSLGAELTSEFSEESDKNCWSIASLLTMRSRSTTGSSFFFRSSNSKPSKSLCSSSECPVMLYHHSKFELAAIAIAERLPKKSLLSKNLYSTTTACIDKLQIENGAWRTKVSHQIMLICILARDFGIANLKSSDPKPDSAGSCGPSGILKRKARWVLVGLPGFSKERHGRFSRAFRDSQKKGAAGSRGPSWILKTKARRVLAGLPSAIGLRDVSRLWEDGSRRIASAVVAQQTISASCAPPPSSSSRQWTGKPSFLVVLFCTCEPQYSMCN